MALNLFICIFEVAVAIAPDGDIGNAFGFELDPLVIDVLLKGLEFARLEKLRVFVDPSDLILLKHLTFTSKDKTKI